MPRFEHDALPAWFGPSLGADDKRARHFVHELCENAGLLLAGIEALEPLNGSSRRHLVQGFARDALEDVFGGVDAAIKNLLACVSVWRGSNFFLAAGQEVNFYWTEGTRLEPEAGVYVLSFGPLIIITRFMAVLVLASSGEIVTLVEGDDGWSGMIVDEPT